MKVMCLTRYRGLGRGLSPWSRTNGSSIGLQLGVERLYKILNPILMKHDPFLDNIRGEERVKKPHKRMKYKWKHFEE